MKVVIGIPGSRSGLLLRIGQCLFAGASIGVMVTALGFSNYTAFCYLIASMALQLMWSLGLSCLDIYALWKKRDLYSPILVSLFVVGDWVTATLSFAGACSSAGVAALFARDVHYCRLNPQLPCGTYETSIALSFVACLLIASSALIMEAIPLSSLSSQQKYEEQKIKRVCNKCTQLVGERGREPPGPRSIPLQGGGASFGGISRGLVARG